MAGIPCIAEDCPNEAKKGVVCEAHSKQRQRTGSDVLKPLRAHGTPRDAIRRAALAYAEAETDEEYERSERALETALKRHVQSMPWVRELLRWAVQMREFQGEMAKAARKRPPLPSLSFLAWVGADVAKALRKVKR